MRRESAVRVGLVARPLLVEHVQLHLQVAVEAVAIATSDLPEDVDQAEADELVAHAVPVLELGRRDDLGCNSMDTWNLRLELGRKLRVRLGMRFLAVG